MSEREEDPKHPRKGVTGAHENFEVIEIEDQDSHGGFQGKMDYPPSHKLNQTYTPSVSSSSTSSRSTGSRVKTNKIKTKWIICKTKFFSLLLRIWKVLAFQRV